MYQARLSKLVVRTERDFSSDTNQPEFNDMTDFVKEYFEGELRNCFETLRYKPGKEEEEEGEEESDSGSSEERKLSGEIRKVEQRSENQNVGS